MNSATDWTNIRKTLQPYMAMAPEFRKRFAGAKLRLAALKKQTLASVVRWDWYTDFHHELDPVHFTLDSDDEVKPGRMLKREPSSKLGTVRYGYDAQGRIVADEKYLTSEEFREYKPGRIDTARYHSSKKCIDVQSLFLDRGMPLAFVSYNKTDLRIRLFDRKGEAITGVCEGILGDATTPPIWNFRRYAIAEKQPGKFLVTTEYPNGLIEKEWYISPLKPVKPSPPPVLDLRKDVKEVASILGDIAAKIGKQQRAGGKHAMPPLSAFALSFHHAVCYQPDMTLTLDTRPKHLEDGNWTHHSWASFERPHWKEFKVALGDSGGRGYIVDVKGKRHSLYIPRPGDSGRYEKVEWFGEMLVAALRMAQKKNWLKPLILHPKCLIRLTDHHEYGWRRFAIGGKIDLT